MSATVHLDYDKYNELLRQINLYKEIVFALKEKPEYLTVFQNYKGEEFKVLVTNESLKIIKN